ncbi:MULTISPECIES: GNAT family N-acetyltransferase [unclassified Flavobacterium]|uniref:GNAT family N-acetyltransferase n=1 Tax=unclassified Flavobacterium TaxID=196869 RepID=UPI0026336D9E|nr:GNAT family N-acetyltransferase [Flavobacterium sp.]
MVKFSIVEIEDFEWKNIVSKSKQYDFYHTQSYHLLAKENHPVLCVAYFNDDFIALPLIIRDIVGTPYKDCTSVYGYCGPISSMDFNKIPDEIIQSFQNKLLVFFKENNIITAFSRLHPLIANEKLFDGFGIVKDINKTIAIDLRLSLDEQRKQYRKSNKSELNQLRRKGFQVIESQNKSDVDTFVSIYQETMRRVEASESYFFDKDYFYDFLNNSCFENKLLLAKKDNIITAGAIFTITDKIMQYHLAGTTEAYIKETPMKLILDEARLLGNDLGVDFLHLGGGVGGSDEDSLFRFKSGFSDYRCNYKVWQFIVDPEKYDELVKNCKVVRTNFFPLYRS